MAESNIYFFKNTHSEMFIFRKQIGNWILKFSAFSYIFSLYMHIKYKVATLIFVQCRMYISLSVLYVL